MVNRAAVSLLPSLQKDRMTVYFANIHSIQILL